MRHSSGAHSSQVGCLLQVLGVSFSRGSAELRGWEGKVGRAGRGRKTAGVRWVCRGVWPSRRRSGMGGVLRDEGIG